MNITLTLGWWMIPIALVFFATFMNIWVEVSDAKAQLNYRKHVHRRLGSAFYITLGMILARYL